MAKSKPSGLANRFTRANAAVKHRIICALNGEVGAWKTSWALGAPGPMLVQNLDRGLEGVIEPFQELREIYVTNYDSNTHELAQIENDEQRQEAAEAIAASIESDLLDALANGIRSIVWDKEGQIYDIVKYAMLGGKESDNPNRFYPVHQRLGSWINALKDSDANLICIRGMKTPWVNEVKGSGKIGAAPSKKDRIPRGWGQLEEHMHLNILNRAEIEETDEGEKITRVYMDIGKSRGPGGREIQNTSIPFVTFPEFATLVFPDTTEEDWQ